MHILDNPKAWDYAIKQTVIHDITLACKALRICWDTNRKHVVTIDEHNKIMPEQYFSETDIPLNKSFLCVYFIGDKKPKLKDMVQWCIDCFEVYSNMKLRGF